LSATVVLRGDEREPVTVTLKPMAGFRGRALSADGKPLAGCRAALPATLASATVRFGLLVAAGSPAAGVIPSHVARLAAGVTGAMFLSKAKIATAVVLAALALAGALTHRALADKRAAGGQHQTAHPPLSPNVGEKAG
jgi:hypothetical protein